MTKEGESRAGLWEDSLDEVGKEATWAAMTAPWRKVASLQSTSTGGVRVAAEASASAPLVQMGH